MQRRSPFYRCPRRSASIPWEEAAKLARLPRVSAAKKLLKFIAATPDAPTAYLCAKTVSDRLIDLLPSG